MPEYCFKCFICGKKYVLEKGMAEVFLEEQLKCKKKGCTGKLERDYKAEMESKATIIPEEHRGINQTKVKFDYTKSPSGKKHIW